MLMLLTIRTIYKDPAKYADQEITLKGWIRNHRDQKEFGFINLNDGTFFENIQVVYEKATTKDFDQVTHLSVGSSIEVKGILVLTPERSQPFELKALEVNLIGDRSEEHTSELQSRPHLVCRLLLEKKKKTTTTSVR